MPCVSAALGWGRGVAHSAAYVIEVPGARRKTALRFRPRASHLSIAVPGGAWLTVRGARRRGGLRACTDCRRFVARDQVTLKFPWLSPPPFRPGAGRPRPLAVRASFKICFPSKIFFLPVFLLKFFV